MDIRAGLGKQSQQLDRLVNRNAASDTKNDLFTFEHVQLPLTSTNRILKIRIILSFVADGRFGAMSGICNHIVRQREELGLDGGQQLFV